MSFDDRHSSVLIMSIRDAMRRATLKDWDIELERFNFRSLLELHLFCLTVEAAIKQEREGMAQRASSTGISSVECPYCHWGIAPSVLAQHIREKHLNDPPV